MKSEESQHQQAFFQWLAVNEKHCPHFKWFFHIPNGGNRNIVTASRMKREGVKRGVLDIFNHIGSRNHKGLWVEMKSSVGRLSKEQKEWVYELETEGYKVAICRDWREAANAAIDYFDLNIKI